HQQRVRAIVDSDRDFRRGRRLRRQHRHPVQAIFASAAFAISAATATRTEATRKSATTGEISSAESTTGSASASSTALVTAPWLAAATHHVGERRGRRRRRLIPALREREQIADDQLGVPGLNVHQREGAK